MDPFVLVPLAYLAAVSVPLAVTDSREHRLPNALVVPGLVVLAWALVGAALRGHPDVLAGLAGAAAGAGVLGAGWALGAVGMGDVKLGVWLGGLAGMMGMLGRPEVVASGLVAGGALAGVQLAATFVGGAPLIAARIPLGPALLTGFWTAIARAFI
ncbi:prepilin peptidase [Herbiconiux sp. P17]|uniref:prepilin peptidase n=1 Tax=Herbiconiux wuyangfengii TaxID=3342794 RepID=UPI0035B7BAA6